MFRKYSYFIEFFKINKYLFQYLKKFSGLYFCNHVFSPLIF